MRLTKLEKQVDQLVADGKTPTEIAALLNLSKTLLLEIMQTVNAKYKARELVEARKRDNIMRNEILAPKFYGLKCKNLGQPNPKYWLFEGDTHWATKAQAALVQLGIHAPVKPNGSNGHSILIVDKWVSGELWEGAQARWQQTNEINETGKEESHVNNSITDTTSTTREVFNQSTQSTYREERRLFKSVA